MKYKILSWLNDIWYAYFRLAFSFLFFVGSKICWALGVKGRALDFVMSSLRYKNNSSAASHLKKIISADSALNAKVSVGVGIGEAAERSIIVKWPSYDNGSVNKGVIIITFTRTFSYYLRNVDLEVMAEHFVFMLEPSWSGYADPDILAFCGRLQNVIVAASEVEDRVLLNCFPETFISASFGASDWVDAKVFENKKMAKIYDSIYIANTNPIKRVKRYLDAIRNIVRSGQRDYVGCLVCASWGGAEELIKKLVDSYQLSDNLVLKFSLGRDQVIECLNQSKVNILLSFKEGSNRSLFESMFCETPVICLSENVGVNKSYINEFTGLLIPDAFLEASLLWFSNNHQRYQTRRWAEENISPRKTSEKLRDLINSRLSKDAQVGSLYVKTNNPEVSYLDYAHIDHNVFTKEVLQLFGAKDAVRHDLDGYSLRMKKIQELFENSLLADALIDR